MFTLPAPPGPSKEPHISVAIGITVGLLASFVQSLGLTIQRKSHVLNQAKLEHERVAERKRPLWLLGFGIFISSNILGSIFQIASLPVIILAPLGAVSLLWNAFFSRLLLGDRFHQFIIVGTFLIVGGAVMIAIGGIVPEPTHSLEDLLTLFRRKAFIVYFALLGSGLGILLIITHIADWTYTHSSAYLTPPPTPPDLPSETTPLIIDNKSVSRLSTNNISRTPTLLAISYASASGILSGMCLLFAKSGVELLIVTMGGDNQFWRWESWALIGGLVVFALLQLWYLHISLILADPTLVCPLAFCFYNISTILNGLVYYDQFAVLSSTQVLLVAGGVVVLLIGVWAVSGGMSQEVAEQQIEEESGPVPVVDGPTILTEEAEEEAVSFPTTSAPPTPSPSTLIRSPPRIRPPPHARSSSSISYTALPLSPTSTPNPTSPRRRRASLLGADLPLNGFSIGLSPISPGFGPVPRRASRRNASIASGSHARRSVSESGLGGDWDADDVIGRWKARDRWRWVREIFLRKRSSERGRQHEGQ